MDAKAPDLGLVHVAITGATGGIGRALVADFSTHGYSVTLVARRRALLEEIAGQAKGPTFVAACDLEDREATVGWIREAEEALGPIDVLVNCAGSVISKPFDHVGDEEAEAIVGLDLVVPLILNRAVVLGMVARGRGVIVNIASAGALAPNPGMVHYCAAKAGLAAASESLRGELRGSGVRVVTAYPGPISTEMLRRAEAGYPLSRIISGLPKGAPAELARRIRVAVESGSARVIYPRVYALFRYLPWVARWLLDWLTPPPIAPSSAHSEGRQ